MGFHAAGAQQQMGIPPIQRDPGPIGLAPSERFPRTRLVMGLWAGVIALAMNWHAGVPMDDLTGAAVTRAIPERVVIVSALEPLPPDLAAPRPLTSLPPSQVGAMPVRMPPTKSPSPAKRHQVQRTSATVQAQSYLPSSRHAGVSPRSVSHKQIAQIQLSRRRSDVRREFIASRDQVAALTGEDSGSSYLTRVSARQSAAHGKMATNARIPPRQLGRRRLGHA
jgi:hypothetical protein